MMDGSYFALGLIGLLLGWIAGDFQRELRFRREARANLALANRRANPDTNHDDGARTGAHSYSDGAAHYVNVQRRDARRRAVRGDNVRSGPVSATAGRYLRSADAAPVVMAGRGWDFDGD